LLELVKKYNSIDVLYALATNKNTPPDALAEIEELAVDRYTSCYLMEGISICLTKWKILTLLASNDATPPEMLRRIVNLYIEDSPHIYYSKWSAAMRGYRPEKQLCLYKDGTLMPYDVVNPVLAGIWGNPNTPADVKQMVSEHIDNLPESC